jgi:hypothetical protein
MWKRLVLIAIILLPLLFFIGPYNLIALSASFSIHNRIIYSGVVIIDNHRRSLLSNHGGTFNALHIFLASYCLSDRIPLLFMTELFFGLFGLAYVEIARSYMIKVADPKAFTGSRNAPVWVQDTTLASEHFAFFASSDFWWGRPSVSMSMSIVLLLIVNYHSYSFWTRVGMCLSAHAVLVVMVNIVQHEKARLHWLKVRCASEGARERKRRAYANKRSKTRGSCGRRAWANERSEGAGR